MLYNPDSDFYELLEVSADADEEEIRQRIASLRGQKRGPDLDAAALVLLDLRARTQYDTARANHRMRRLLRDSLDVFTGRTPAQGVPRSWWPTGTDE